jgi:hypothetical protein
MPRLKSRQKYIPNGFVFYQPQTKWSAPSNASFDVIVSAVISHRQGQPHIVSQFGLSTDYATVAEEVDAFNATICQRMGWTDFYVEGGSSAVALPFQQAALPPMPPIDQNKLAVAAAKVKKIWIGIKTLKEWAESGAPAVPAELSAKRAAVCATCPKNGQGDFTSWFTRPASEGIMKMIDLVKSRNLTTPDDDKLNICETCLCPMKAKVHPTIEIINSWMGDVDRAELSAVQNPSGGCWIVKEIWPERYP